MAIFRIILRVQLLGCILFTFQSCGGGSDSDNSDRQTFQSSKGTWHLDAQKVEGSCSSRFGGYTGDIIVAVDGAAVTITFGSDVSPVLLGSTIPGGVVASAIVPSQGAEVRFGMSIENIDGSYSSGDATYSYDYIDPDGVNLCHVIATEPAIHTSQKAE